MAVLDALFKAKFWNYGSDVYRHAMYSDTGNNDGADSYPNAKCNLFPTEVRVPDLTFSKTLILKLIFLDILQL